MRQTMQASDYSKRRTSVAYLTRDGFEKWLEAYGRASKENDPKASAGSVRARRPILRNTLRGAASQSGGHLPVLEQGRADIEG
jgi:hypothetical protein